MVGSVGVIDVDLGRSPDVSDLLALDQADDKEDQKCDNKGTCLYQITVRRASLSTPVDQTDHDDETFTWDDDDSKEYSGIIGLWIGGYKAG